MFNLNLLPPEKKTKLKQERVIYLLKTIAYTLVVFIIISLGLFYGTRLYLDQKLNKINEEIMVLESKSQNNSQATFTNTVKEINDNITKISTIQNNYVKWSEFIKDLTKLIPDNIQLDELSFNQENKQFSIKGIAPLRNDFLTLESNLKNSTLFENIDSPISNLIKKEDINFSLTATMILGEYNL